MVIAGIVAGGSGLRMGTDIPKQFLDLDGRPVIIHTVENFIKATEIDHIIVGVHPDWVNYTQELLKKYFDEDIEVTAGGADRNETLSNIIRTARKLYDPAEDCIFITHDAVRPFVTRRMISENIAAAREYGVCGTVIPATDTIIRSEEGEYVSEIPLRSQMFQAQTPQTFTLRMWEEAYSQLTEEQLREATDACRLFWLCNIKVRLVNGDITNLKITYPQDIERAGNILKTFDYDNK